MANKYIMQEYEQLEGKITKAKKMLLDEPLLFIDGRIRKSSDLPPYAFLEARFQRGINGITKLTIKTDEGTFTRNFLGEVSDLGKLIGKETTLLGIAVEDLKDLNKNPTLYQQVLRIKGRRSYSTTYCPEEFVQYSNFRLQEK